MFPLALRVEGVDVVAVKSRRVYVIRALLGMLALPFICVVLAAIVELEVFYLLALASLLFGVSLLVLSGYLSRRRMVRFDRSRNVVVAHGIEHPFAGLELRVRVIPGLSQWHVIELARNGTSVVTIHDRLQRFQEPDIHAHTDYLARILGDAPVTGITATATRSHLINDNTAAMLCYLPFQGINIIASLYYLFAARDRPFVRFAAKQSLTQMGVTLLMLLVVGLAFGIPLAIFNEGAAAIVFGVLLGVSLATVAIGNIVAILVACVRANGGKLWVIPWLRFLLNDSVERLAHIGDAGRAK